MGSKAKKSVLYSLGVVMTIVLGVVGYVKFFLPDVGAAPYLEVERTPERVKRGEYLATHVAVCMDCHSTRDWSRYSGPLVDGTLGKGGEYFGPEMGFPGRFYSRNITPANLQDWTDGEIFRAITSGVDREGKALFPVMPYANYGKMDKEDIYDIIAYLRSLSPIESEVPHSKADFPVNFIINTIPKKPALTIKPEATDKERYGGYLVNAASCIECHTQVERGQIISELAFSGGREFAMPGGVVRSANITPDKETGIGSWSKESFVARFKAFDNQHAAAPVKENDLNTIMPWAMYAGMKTEDLEAIYAYLQTLKPMKNEVVVFSGREL